MNPLRNRVRARCAWLALSGLVLASGALADDAWQTVRPGGDTLCADGSPYEFHVREGDPGKVMLFFNGGGACWSAQSCDPANNPADGRFTYRVGAGPDWGNDPRALGGAFDTDNPANPFRDWTQVFAAYCTGDVHLGTRDMTYRRDDGSTMTIHHRGRINARAVLDYLYQHYEAPGRVLVSGASAGAVASPLLAAEVAGHYPQADIVQFAGGGGGYRMPPPTPLWRNWGVFQNLPAWFDGERYTDQNTGLLDLYRVAAGAFPDIRFHQYDNAYDQVQELFLEKLGHPAELLPGLDANREELAEELPYFRAYTAAGEFHTLLRFPVLYTEASAGVPALDWVRDLAAGKTVPTVHCEAPCGRPALDSR